MASSLLLLSDEQIGDAAAFDITETLDLYDPRFGNAGSVEVMCPTCNMRGDVCMGHHAALCLGLTMFHPLLYKQCQDIVNTTCLECGEGLLSKDGSQTLYRRAKMCSNCGHINHGDYIIHTNNLTFAVRRQKPGALQEHEDRVYAHNIKDVLPSGYAISSTLVPPIHLRTPEEMEWSTDIQKMYEQLVTSVHNLRTRQAPFMQRNSSSKPFLGIQQTPKRGLQQRPEIASGSNQRSQSELRGRDSYMQPKIAGAIPVSEVATKRASTIPKKVFAKNRPKDRDLQEGYVCAAYARIVGAHKTEGIISLMSGKAGIFRQLMLGKRVESSGRAVVVGDPCLGLDEVGVPKVVSDSIRVKTSCTKYNIAHLRDLAKDNKLWWDGTDDVVSPLNILPGMGFYKGLETGDFAMLNRQPSLSRFSLMCFKVVVGNAGDAEERLPKTVPRDSFRGTSGLYRNVIRINPQATAPFNADFDGDEMNLFFMSDRAEMATLCNLYECMDMVVPVQDVVTGCYIMSKNRGVAVGMQVWDDCVAL